MQDMLVGKASDSYFRADVFINCTHIHMLTHFISCHAVVHTHAEAKIKITIPLYGRKEVSKIT